MKNLLLFGALLLIASCTPQEKFKYNKSIPQIQFAVEEIRKAEAKSTASYFYAFELEDNICDKGGFAIEVDKQTVSIKSQDVNGLMYGGLEIAEQLLLYNSITPTKHNPFIANRGIKMNIPLDARTPSYDDSGDAAQKNITTVWEWDFWTEYLDNMAKYRYNVLTLWNPHPFPSMIKMEEYPDVALNDVCVTTLKPVGIENEWAEPQMVSSNVLENLKVVKSISIDEKIAFWKKVMQYAHDRGIDIYYFNWNMCPNGVAKPVKPFYRTYKQPLWDEEPGKYGISNQMDNPLNVKYYRSAIKKFLETYPLIKGIGVTAGEHMMDTAGAYTREQWIWETYGLGILDAAKENPDRKIDFIHRVWNTNMDKIFNYWDKYPFSFEASFKYAKARLYSSPKIPFADKHIESMQKYGLKSWWNLRNDDIFVHRWGNPEYVREFLEYMNSEHMAGFYMGSDGYVWARVFNSKIPELANQLEFKKHWYKFMLWGRLAYDNKLDENFFKSHIKLQYPDANENTLYNTWKYASEIFPLVNQFHWNDWDYQWAVEACIDTRIGFHDVKRFMTNRTMLKSNILNPLAYAQTLKNKKHGNKITPFQISDSLKTSASKALLGIKELKKENISIELNALLDDIESMAYLGQYYSAKINAATHLALYKEGFGLKHKKEAIELLKNCVNYWTIYAHIQDRNYESQMLARTGNFDVFEILEEVKKDIIIAESINL